MSYLEWHNAAGDHDLDPYYVTYDGNSRQWQHCRICDHVASDVNVMDITVTDDDTVVRRVIARSSPETGV